MGRARTAASALAALLALLPRQALADDAQQFDLAKSHYYAGQYDEVVKRFTILLDGAMPLCSAVEGPSTQPQNCRLADPVLAERAREMLTVALVALKRLPEADLVIERLLRNNPTYNPEPGSMPAEVMDRFREMRQKLQAELEEAARKRADEERKNRLLAQKAAEEEKKWVAEIERLAAKETVLERRSRLVASVPFGVGQIQNGDTGLGVFFAVSEAATGIASIALAGSVVYFNSIDTRNPDPATGVPFDRNAKRQALEITTVANQITFGTWAALTVAGVLQANIAFQPEVPTTRDRPIPKRPAPFVAPTIAVFPGGGMIGVNGSF